MGPVRWPTARRTHPHIKYACGGASCVGACVRAWCGKVGVLVGSLLGDWASSRPPSTRSLSQSTAAQLLHLGSRSRPSSPRNLRYLCLSVHWKCINHASWHRTANYLFLDVQPPPTSVQIHFCLAWSTSAPSAALTGGQVCTAAKPKKLAHERSSQVSLCAGSLGASSSSLVACAESRWCTCTWVGHGEIAGHPL